MGDSPPENRTLGAAITSFALTLSALQHTLARLAEQVGQDPVSPLSGDQLESAWKATRSRYEQVEAKFSELAESAEDAMDVADALAARDEGGESVSLEELKAELGIE